MKRINAFIAGEWIVKNKYLKLVAPFLLIFSLFISVWAVSRPSMLRPKASSVNIYYPRIDTTLYSSAVKIDPNKSTTLVSSISKTAKSKVVVGFDFPGNGNYESAVFRIKPQKTVTPDVNVYLLMGEIGETDVSLKVLDTYPTKLIGKMSNSKKSSDGYLEINVTETVNSVDNVKIYFLLENLVTGTNTYYSRESSTKPQLVLNSPTSTSTVFTLVKNGNVVARPGDYVPLKSNIVSPQDTISYIEFQINPDSRLSYLGFIKKSTCIVTNHNCYLTFLTPPILGITANQATSPLEIDGDMVELWYKVPDNATVGTVYNNNLVSGSLLINPYTVPITDATVNGSSQISITNNVPYCNLPYSESHRSLTVSNAVTNVQANIPYAEIDTGGPTGLFAKIEIYGVTNNTIPPTSANTIHYGTLENTTYTQLQTGASQHLILAFHGPTSPQAITHNFEPRTLSLMIDGEQKTIYVPPVQIYNNSTHDEWMAFYPTTDGSSYHANNVTSTTHQIDVYPSTGVSALNKVATLSFAYSIESFNNAWRARECVFGDQPVFPTPSITPTLTPVPPTATPVPPTATPVPPTATPAFGSCYGLCRETTDCRAGLVCYLGKTRTGRCGLPNHESCNVNSTFELCCQ
ncbi:hypothetical protein IPM62_05215 [Candidatus Woesebacteria bacterium]|nr:MAG: hypothetical protein IPM62_05215 [Candidatus Woesebacteria bacterium]